MFSSRIVIIQQLHHVHSNAPILLTFAKKFTKLRQSTRKESSFLPSLTKCLMGSFASLSSFRKDPILDLITHLWYGDERKIVAGVEFDFSCYFGVFLKGGQTNELKKKIPRFLNEIERIEGHNAHFTSLHL